MFFDTAAFNADISKWHVQADCDMNGMFVEAVGFSRNFFCDDSPLADSALTPTDFQGSAVSDMTCYDAMSANGPFVMRNVNIRAMIKKVYACNTSPSECTGNPPHSEGSPPTSSTLLSAFGSIENWDVSRVTNFKSLFIEVAGSYAGDTFNADLSKWNVGNVVTMQNMLGGEGSGRLPAFNSQLSSWVVSNVKSMRNGKIIYFVVFFYI